MTPAKGTPVWFELTCARGKSSVAHDFYAAVFGWDVVDSGMPEMTYHLAQHDGQNIAGMMELPPEAGEIPPNWLLYFETPDCDAAVKAFGAAGGALLNGPMDVPGTGRFAVVTDPQGAAVGVLSSADMPGGPDHTPFAMGRAGHATWVELMTTDPEAAKAFYTAQFGWVAHDVMDGESGPYHLFGTAENPIGGMMGLADAPMPYWLVYFMVDSCSDAVARITQNGGTVAFGPVPVPGDMNIAVATDPMGAWFGVMGG